MDQNITESAPITLESSDSSLHATSSEISITISCKYWTQRQLKLLLNVLLLLVNGSGWVTKPNESSNSITGDGQPRWKAMKLDVFSIVVFALLIPQSHFLRKLFDAIDWTSIDKRCAEFYKNHDRGAPAYPPQVLFRILVLMFVSGTPFESTTLLRLKTDVAWRWFAGMDLLSGVPDAGTLTRFRDRLGIECFEQILIDLLLACDKAGLIGHEDSFYDMTGVEATATQVTPYQRAVILTKALTLYLEKNQEGTGTITPEQIAGIALEVLEEKHSSLKHVSPQQVVNSRDKQHKEQGDTTDKQQPGWLQRITQKISELKPEKPSDMSVDEHLRQTARELLPVLPQAFGNPDASVGHTRTDGTICGYRSGFLVDARHHIITALIFVTLTTAEAPTVVNALEKHHAVFGRYPKRLGLDSAFDRDEVHQHTEQHNIFCSASIRARPGLRGVFHSDKFIWNEQEQLMCPNEKLMEQIGGPYKDGAIRYRSTGECSQCPLLEQCLTEKQRQKGIPCRELRTNPTVHQRAQRHRERSRSGEGKELRRSRFASEGVFGHINRFHNGDKAPYRNAAMDHIAQIMVVFVYNLEKLSTYS